METLSYKIHKLSNLERHMILFALEDLQRYYENWQKQKETDDVAYEYFSKRIEIITNLLPIFSTIKPSYFTLNL